MGENEIMQETPKNDAPKVKELSLQQEINIISGIIFLILMPLGLGIAVAVKINIAYWVYVIFFFDYLFWFFTAQTVYGTLADKNLSKYKILDYISKICVTICPLFVILVVASSSYFFVYSGRDYLRNFFIMMYGSTVLSAIAVFSICRYLEVLFVLLDIRKTLNASQQKAKEIILNIGQEKE